MCENHREKERKKTEGEFEAKTYLDCSINASGQARGHAQILGPCSGQAARLPVDARIVISHGGRQVGEDPCVCSIHNVSMRSGEGMRMTYSWFCPERTARVSCDTSQAGRPPYVSTASFSTSMCRRDVLAHLRKAFSLSTACMDFAKRAWARSMMWRGDIGLETADAAKLWLKNSKFSSNLWANFLLPERHDGKGEGTERAIKKGQEMERASREQ